MPRSEKVFEAKTKSKTYEEVPWPADKENYTSAKDNAGVPQVPEGGGAGGYGRGRGRVGPEELWDEFPAGGPRGLGKERPHFRVVHDGTHGVGVNPKIKVLDRGPGEVRMAMEVLSPASFCLARDVSRAEWLVRVREEDWGLMACKTGVSDDGTESTKVWLNCVGMLGITSASYHFTRLFGAMTRPE